MKECIICRKEIFEAAGIVTLDETHACHINCFYELVPPTKSQMRITKEEDDSRTDKIEKLATELIKKYDDSKK